MQNNTINLQDTISKLSDQIQDTMDLILAQPNSYSSGRTLCLEGTFEAFEEDTHTLCITINNSITYYPLTTYNSAWLPFIGDTVQIFSADKKPTIIGFMENGEEIPNAPHLEAKIRFYSPTSRLLKAQINEKLISMTIPKSIIDKKTIRIGDTILFKHIQALPTDYYLPLDKPTNTRESIDILRIIK